MSERSTNRTALPRSGPNAAPTLCPIRSRPNDSFRRSGGVTSATIALAAGWNSELDKPSSAFKARSGPNESANEKPISAMTSPMIERTISGFRPNLSAK